MVSRTGGTSARSLYLVVTHGTATGTRLRVDETARVVGRGRDADLVLRDPHASREHVLVRARAPKRTSKSAPAQRKSSSTEPAFAKPSSA